MHGIKTTGVKKHITLQQRLKSLDTSKQYSIHALYCSVSNGHG